jgi:hypothetical protein
MTAGEAGSTRMAIARLAVAVLIVLAAPAQAGSGDGTTMPAAPPIPENSVQSMPKVAPGDQIAIACDPLQSRGADSDVRVVLTVSAMPGEADLGYKKVLATDAQLLKDAVRVRIPEAPDLDDHTVDLDVYVVNDKGSQRCNAGHMKIS